VYAHVYTPWVRKCRRPWHRRAAYLTDCVVMMPGHTFLCLTQGRIFSPLLNAGYHMGSF